MARRTKSAAIFRLVVQAIACLAASYAQTPEDSGLPVRFDAALLQVDAVVTDAHGGHIRDLKASDFSILQDGKTRKLTSFSYRNDADQPRTIVFLVNDANMLPMNMVRVRDALSRFTHEQLKPADKVAILTTMGGPGYLRQFLPIGSALHAAIDDLHARPAALDSAVSSRTIEVVRRTIVALAGLPGRKCLVVLSNDMLDQRFDLRSIADTASRASVVVHVIDPSPYAVHHLSDGFLPALAAVTCGLKRDGGLDLQANLRAAMEDQAEFYLLGWDPGPALKQLWSWPVYHRLSVRASRPDLTVRSREGFFGVTGPVAAAPSASSKTQQLLNALYTPLRPQQVSVHVTPVPRQRDKEFYVQSLLHISSGIEFTSDKDDCYRAAISVYSSIVRLNSSDDPTFALRGAQLRMCGQLPQRVREQGLIATVEQKLPGPGQYQVYFGVRNGTIGPEDLQARRSNTLIRRADWKQEAAQMGTASEFLDVPDTTIAGAVFPSLFLRGMGALATGAGKPAEIIFRTVSPGDPAIRNFHSGDVLKYDAGANATFEITHDGDVVDSGKATGTYRLKDSLSPGQYLLRENAATGTSANQWTDFRIVN